jgi:hypothetical protein
MADVLSYAQRMDYERLFQERAQLDTGERSVQLHTSRTGGHDSTRKIKNREYSIP